MNFVINSSLIVLEIKCQVTRSVHSSFLLLKGKLSKSLSKPDLGVCLYMNYCCLEFKTGKRAHLYQFKSNKGKKKVCKYAKTEM